MDFNQIATEGFTEAMENLTAAIREKTELELESQSILTAEELGEKLSLNKATILSHAKGYSDYPTIFVATKCPRFRFNEVIDWYKENGHRLNTRADLEKFKKEGKKVQMAGAFPVPIVTDKKAEKVKSKRGRKLKSMPSTKVA